MFEQITGESADGRTRETTRASERSKASDARDPRFGAEAASVRKPGFDPPAPASAPNATAAARSPARATPRARSSPARSRASTSTTATRPGAGTF